MAREASPVTKREKPTPGKAFWVLSIDEMQMTLLDFRGVAKMSGNPSYRTCFLADAPGGFMVNKPLKRRHGAAGPEEFPASFRVSAACENGGKRP